MSAIAGILRFGGAPAESSDLAAMMAAMPHRAPDGEGAWHAGSVAFGHGMLRTTPESVAERQPCVSADGKLVLVMDGRLDDRARLRDDLVARGAVPRDETDAEYALCAYLAWGEACPEKLTGEFVFVLWDARGQCVFGARDVAGTRHFYYHADRAGFAFASEIKGLLALPWIKRDLNESRLLDFLVPALDRDDTTGTFYRDILRLPAGHAMSVSERGVRAWRYWHPESMSPLAFASLDACAEAFGEVLRRAVACRMRALGPLGAMLSGGLDSSSVVALIGERRAAIPYPPLRTYSLIQSDREHCQDWLHLRHFLDEPWIDATLIEPDTARTACRRDIETLADQDEPFALSHGLNYALAYKAAGDAGCRVVFDGMAGDVLFHDPYHSLARVAGDWRVDLWPGMIRAMRGHGLTDWPRYGAWHALKPLLPVAARRRFRAYRDQRNLLVGDMRLLRPGVAARHLAAHRAGAAARDEVASGGRSDDLARHAGRFTGGLISFAHEVYGEIAWARGVEPRSPFSDRRLIEFAVRMPLSAKLALPSYKHLLRRAMAGCLPDAVRMRTDVGRHPGWQFHREYVAELTRLGAGEWSSTRVADILHPWIDKNRLIKYDAAFRAGLDDSNENLWLPALVLARWLVGHRG